MRTKDKKAKAPIKKANKFDKNVQTKANKKRPENSGLFFNIKIYLISFIPFNISCCVHNNGNYYK